MLKCQKIKEHLVAYLDKELQPALKDEIEGHLLSCPYCQAEISTFKRVWSLIDEYEVTETSDFEQRFQERIRTARTQIIRLVPPFLSERAGKEENILSDRVSTNRPTWLRPTYWFLAATAAAILLGFTFAFINHTRQTGQSAVITPAPEQPVINNIEVLELAEPQNIVYFNDLIELDMEYNPIQPPDEKKQLEEKDNLFYSLPTEKREFFKNKFRQLAPEMRKMFEDVQGKLNRIPPAERYFIRPAVRLFEERPEAEQNSIKKLPPAERQKTLYLLLENEIIKYYQLKASQRSAFKKLSFSEKWQKIKYWLEEQASPHLNDAKGKSKSGILREKSERLKERRRQKSVR
ncbi:MAG: zf-HC2 domain-containing protein [Planctomycetota bacterium]